MRLCRRGILIVIASIGLTAAFSSEASAQWRGRYVRRDGPFHVEKYHWGGGITPTGATVINTALTTLAPLAQQALKRDEDTRGISAQERDSILASDRQKLEEARQIRARTERLAASIGITPSVTPSTETPAVSVSPSAQPFLNWGNSPSEPPKPLGSSVDPNNPFKRWGNSPSESPNPLE